MISSLCFSSSENVLILPSFLKDIFTWYRILAWQYFSFCTWKMYYFLLAPMVSCEKSTLIQVVAPLQVISHFFSSCFQDFSLSLFPKFDYNVHGLGFLLVYPVWSLISFLNLCLYLLPIWGIFQHYFFIHFFSSIFFLLFFRDFNRMNVRSFITSPEIPQTLLFFSVIYSFFWSDWADSFYCVNSILLLSLSLEFVISVIGLFHFSFFYLVILYTLYFSAETFNLFQKCF